MNNSAGKFCLLLFVFFGLIVARGLSAPQSAFGQDDRMFYGGIFFGHIQYLHPDGLSMVVEPIEERFGRLRFYLDKQTRYRIDGKRAKRSRIFEGQKVAVRYFAEKRVAVAEVVFVEHDDFQPTILYTDRKKRKKRKKRKRTVETEE